MYQLIIKKEALKELMALPAPFVNKITLAIELLRDNPRPHGSLKLKGSTENLWRIRIGDYRVIYHIDDTVRIVNIRNVGNRRDIYD